MRGVHIAAQRRVRAEHVDASGQVHQLFAGGTLDLAPDVVGGGRQPHVVRVVVGQPDQPRMVVRPAAIVTERKLLQADHARAHPRCPAGRGAAHAAQSDNGHVGGRL
jgi:hypothetical protein